MEQTAARIALLPRRQAMAGLLGRWAAAPRTAPSRCSIHWFRGATHLKLQAQSKRIAILDPFAIERRLLVALAEAQGHRVLLYRDIDDLLAGLREAPPEIVFVHMCFDSVIRRIGEAGPLPPVVLIDSCSITGQGESQLAPFGDFTAMRFPIGLHEFAEAVHRSAR